MNNDDIQIQLGQSVRRHIESKQSPLKDRALCAAPYDRPDQDKTPVFISMNATRAVEKHITVHKDREVGGVLLGGFYRSEDGSFVEVTDIIEAKGAEGTDVSVTFTHETWEQINAEQASRNPDAQIVGWYHSHPGLGVFMSKEDQFIHSSYFADPWHVALVVDPIYHNWGFFKWNDGALERTGGFHAFAQKKDARQVRDYIKNLNSVRQAPPMDASASADRRIPSAGRSGALWLAVAALLVLQIVTGYVALRRQQATVTERDDYKTAMALLRASDVSDGAQYLRMDLLAHPANSATYRELQRLNTLAAAGLSNEGFDQTNFMLAMADRMARSRIKLPQKSIFEDVIPKSDTPIKLEATDPVHETLQVYRDAAASRAARLQRAVRIASVARGPGEGSRGSRFRNAWYDKAVEWLRGERLREVAYGLHSGVESYQQVYAKLSDKDRAAIKRIRAELMKAK